MENRILEPSGRPRTSELVAELLLLLLLSLSWWIDRQRETAALSATAKNKSHGGPVCLGNSTAPETHSLPWFWIWLPWWQAPRSLSISVQPRLPYQ